MVLEGGAQAIFNAQKEIGRQTECSHFMVDIQGMPALQNTVRIPKQTKHRQKLPKCDWN